MSITLVDRRNYHLFRPMLYQVATGLLSADQIARPLRSILSRHRNVEVLLDEVIGVDPQTRRVRLSHCDLPYDFLIVATGIQYNYFGHDEWQQIAPGLTSLEDAEEIRGKVLLAFDRAERLAALGNAPPEAIQQLLTFVLVGAGTVGVEMASTLAEMSRMALAHDFRHIDPRATQVLLYEAESRVLPAYPETLSAKAQRHLQVSKSTPAHASPRNCKRALNETRDGDRPGKVVLLEFVVPPGNQPHPSKIIDIETLFFPGGAIGWSMNGGNCLRAPGSGYHGSFRPSRPSVSSKPNWCTSILANRGVGRKPVYSVGVLGLASFRVAR